MQYDEIERMVRHALDVLGRDGADFGIAGKARGDAGADPRRAFAQQQLARGGGDAIGMQRFAATVIEHPRLRRGNQRRDLLCDEIVMNVAVARIDIDRMRAVPEREPARAHVSHSASSGPFGPNAGSVKGSGTFRIEATALACSALVRQRLYLPLGG